MYEKLEEVAARYDELTNMLSDPEVLKDQQSFAKLSKELDMKDGFRVVSNCGESAGQSVKHLHFHVMSGRAFTWPAGWYRYRLNN